MNVRQQEVTVVVELSELARLSCPQCAAADCPLYDSRERTWRHLDTCQFKTYIHAKLPRISCAKCGVKTVQPPWAEPHSRFTILFERFAIDALGEMSIAGMCRLLSLSWDQADAIVERAVQRGLQRQHLDDVRRIGIDEKHVGHGAKFITVVTDLVRGCAIWIGKDRTAQTLDPFFELLGPERCANIECISMDMWRPYALACRRHIPQARQKTVLDRFHIERHVGQAVDETRRQENTQLLRKGDRRLKHTRWEWMWNPENMPSSRKEKFETLRKADLNTAKAYAMRLNLRRLWSMSSEAQAREHFMDWHAWATHSNIRPMQRVAKKLLTHLDRILTFIRFRQTNGLAEGINNKIQTVIKKAYGFRNAQRLINAIYFHCGKLHMYPYPP